MTTEHADVLLQIGFTCRQQCAQSRITAEDMYLHMCLYLYGLPCRRAWSEALHEKGH